MREEQPGVKVVEIKKALAHNRKLTENKGQGYTKKEYEWNVYDSSLSDFVGTFRDVLPKDYKPQRGTICDNFKDYLEASLANEKETNLTAVEFGGPGSNLFFDLKSIFQKTVGVCLEDIRDESKQEQDLKINHSIIEGDIMDVLDDNVLSKIKEKLGTNKTNLIISRMCGPLKFIDKNGAILDRLISNWYGLLSDNGMIFIQFRQFASSSNDSIKTLVEKWAAAILAKFPEINIQVSESAMRLQKREGSPEKLPAAYQLFNKN